MELKKIRETEMFICLKEQGYSIDIEKGRIWFNILYVNKILDIIDSENRNVYKH